MTKKRMFFAAILVGVLAGLLTVTATEFRAAGSDAKVMAGSWNVDVSLAVAPQPFKALITFNSDGGVIETDAASFPPPIASASTGHGEWVKTGKREFAFKFVKLLFDTSNHFIGTMTLRSTLRYDKTTEQYDDSFVLDIADPGGNALFTSAGTGHATRIGSGL